MREIIITIIILLVLVCIMSHFAYGEAGIPAWLMQHFWQANRNQQ